MRARSLLPASALVLVAGALPAQTVIFSDDFESGLGAWIAEPLWHVADASSPCLAGASTPFPNGTKCAWFGSEATCDFDTVAWGWADFPTLYTHTPIALPADAPSLLLEFSTKSEGEADGVWDAWFVDVAGESTTSSRLLLNSGWTRRTIDISQFAGQSILLGFRCWPGDTIVNELLGWLVDDIVIRTGEARSARCAPATGSSRPVRAATSERPGTAARRRSTRRGPSSPRRASAASARTRSS